jgi:uncharacterized cupredoxin-like copper-binding protein
VTQEGLLVISSRKVLVLLAVAALVAAVSALGAGASPTASAVAVIAGKPSELRFTLSKKAVPKGLVTFKVTNRGTLGHDFKIAGKKTSKVSPGKSTTLKVTFKKPGRYAFLCTVPGHAAGGMKGVLRVT